jgi:hypothetical protein
MLTFRPSRTIVVATVIVFVGQCEVESGVGHHHHHHKHHGKHRDRSVQKQHSEAGHHAVSQPLAAPAADVGRFSAADDRDVMSTILGKMSKLENDLALRELTKPGLVKRSKILVKGPLPSNFNERFQQAASNAVQCDVAEVRVTDSYPLKADDSTIELVFEAPVDIAKAIVEQATNPESNFTKGDMHEFLVQGVSSTDAVTGGQTAQETARPSLSLVAATTSKDEGQAEPSGEVDIDTEMPYGELEPFGREDTAQELTESSIKESDEMVDQLERAEVAEEKRAVFRALTRLRGAAITSFDGVARSQTGNIDEYNKVHKWRSTHPLRHLASEEADVSRWAFPDTADF